MELTLQLPFFDILLHLPPDNMTMLLVLWILTLVSYYFMRRFRKKRTIKLGNFDTLKQVHGYESMASPVVLAVKIFIITVLFLAATNSVELRTVHPVTDTDYTLAVDSSQSMVTPDYEPNRLEYSKERTVEWLNRMPARANISVITFSSVPKQKSSSNHNPEEAVQNVESINPDLQNPGTALAPAISLGVTTLISSDKEKRLVIITDGENTADQPVSEAVTRAKRNNVSIYILGITSNQRTDELYDSLNSTLGESNLGGEIDRPELDHEQLKQAAEKTGGEYYPIKTEDMFNAAFRDIVIRNERIGLNSDYIIMIFISLLIITETAVYSRYGAI